MTRITVDRLELEKSGTRGGKPWNLFVVHGTDAQGQPLTNVKTFDALPVGEIDVDMSPYTSDAGQSYTAKLKGAKPARTPKANGSSGFEGDVLDRLERIERLLNALVAVYDPTNEAVKS